MKSPYGIADFYALITEGYFYAGRTDRITSLEGAGKHLLFLRPRRFGKNYYDLARLDEFEQLFGRLKIGENLTSLHICGPCVISLKPVIFRYSKIGIIAGVTNWW